jgi:hypothetical protein
MARDGHSFGNQRLDSDLKDRILDSHDDGGVVRKYRLHFYNAEGHTVGPGKIISAKDDNDAIAQARANHVVQDYSMELWESDRLVAKFPRQQK